MSGRIKGLIEADTMRRSRTDALKLLGDDVIVVVGFRDNNHRAVKYKTFSLSDCVEDAVTFYRQLLTSPDDVRVISTRRVVKSKAV